MLNAALATIDSMQPRSELQAVLAVQIIATGFAGLRFLRQSHRNMTEEFINVYGNYAIKLLRLQNDLIQTFDRYQRGNKQTVEVRHVHIHSGGQGVVGIINPPDDREGFLPVLLALSTSSPFWQGHRTGLRGYRLAAYDELPRTGLPEVFKTLPEYQNYVDTLVAAGVIKDASYIWWVIRPSLKHPTLELRIADICTHVEDALCIAALFRCLIRHLVEQPDLNAELGPIARAIAGENKWRAQRYGTSATFVDQQSMKAMPIDAVLHELMKLIRDDAQALACVEEISRANAILKGGSSADQQLRIYEETRAAGRSRQQALKDVVDWLHRA